jgi:hypothetical protein
MFSIGYVRAFTHCKDFLTGFPDRKVLFDHSRITTIFSIKRIGVNKMSEK